MLYQLNDITDLKPWLFRDAARLRTQFVTQAYEDGNILRWNSNNAVIPPHCFRDAHATLPEGQQAAYDAETQASLASYRERMADYVPDAEAMYEMRAAFGTGTTVVNILTGKSTRL